MPDDMITALRDLLHQLHFATGAADRAAEHFPDDLAQRSAYREGTLDLVLDAFARLATGTIG